MYVLQLRSKVFNTQTHKEGCTHPKVCWHKDLMPYSQSLPYDRGDQSPHQRVHCQAGIQAKLSAMVYVTPIDNVNLRPEGNSANTLADHPVITAAL